MSCSWQTQSGTVWAPKDVQIWSYHVYSLFSASQNITHERCKIGLSISKYNRGFIPCCPLVSAFLLINPWYKLNAKKLLIIFLFSIWILWMCYSQLILFPPVLSERREAITGTFTKTRYPFQLHSSWALKVGSLLFIIGKKNFTRTFLNGMNICGERREGFCCLWLPHYMAEIATICNAVFVQHTAPVSALLNMLRHRFISQKTLIAVNV